MSDVLYNPNGLYSAQTMLFKITDHLLSQQERAVCHLNYDSCRYRTENAYGDVTKCAIGCLIPEYMYDIDMEGDSVTGLLRRTDQYPELILHIFPNDMSEEVGMLFVKQLQKIHDSVRMSQWPMMLWFLAATFPSPSTYDLSAVFAKHNIPVDMAGRPLAWDVEDDGQE